MDKDVCAYSAEKERLNANRQPHNGRRPVAPDMGTSELNSLRRGFYLLGEDSWAGLNAASRSATS